MITRIAFFSFMMLSAQLVSAESTLVATLDRDAISLEETATLILSLKHPEAKTLSPPETPKVPGLLIFYRKSREVLSPQAGEVSPAIEFIYTVFPETSGLKKIPSITLHIGGNLYLTKPMLLNVTPKEAMPQEKVQLTEPLRRIPEPYEIRRVFVRAEVDNPRPFVGEPFMVTVWVYATVPFQYQGLKFPPEGTPGFTQFKELGGEVEAREDTEVKDGITYYGRTFEEQVWFCHEMGKQMLHLGEVKLLLKKKANNLFERSFQDALPVGGFQTESEIRDLSIEPILLNVQPLPEENKPEDFSGAVGQFKTSLSLDKTELELGESVTLRYTIEGKGNLKFMEDPVFQDIPFATSFQPRAFDDSRREGSSFYIEKTFETILITNTEGEHTLEPLSFSYFNPRFRKYRVATTEPLTLTIHKKEKVSTEEPREKVEKEEPELLGKDIYYLKKEIGPLQDAGAPFLGSPIFWGLQGLPLMLLGLALGWHSYQQYLVRNAPLLRRRKAFQTAQVLLQKASDSLKRNQLQEFARETQEALLGYLSDKTGIPKGGLTIARVLSVIREAGGDATLETDVQKCLERLQAIQFASLQSLNVDPRTYHDEVKGILRQLEKIQFTSV